MAEGFTLHLRAVPPALMIDLLATLDGLHREIQVAGLDVGSEAPVARSTHDALIEHRDHLEVPRNTILDQAAAARRAGVERVDITTAYRAEEVPRARAATVAVGEADAAARRGDLLASPMTDAQRRLWLWVGAEFDVQSRGGAPTPFDPGDPGNAGDPP